MVADEVRAAGARTPASIVRATWVLVAIRAGYAYNWFDIGPALTGIGASFHVGPAQFGLLAGAFLAGAGLLQVPAGLLGRRYGNRRIALSGAVILSVFGLASGLAPSFLSLLAFRVIAGAGAGLFFSPAISLVAGMYPEGGRGLAVGGFSSAFSAGAAAGVLVTALLLPRIGWQAALLVGGVELGVLCIAGILAIPASVDRPPASTPAAPTAPLAALRFRGVWAIGLAFVGMEGASFATGQFIVPYGEALRGWSPTVAGLVGMMFVLPSVVGGPVGGPIADRRRDHRTQLAAAAGIGAFVLAWLPVAGLAGAIAIGAVFSFAYGFAYAVMYVVPHYWRNIPADQVPLAIGLFNAIQLAGGASVAYVFGRVVARTSYAVGWEVLAVFEVVTLVALFALPSTPARPVEVDPPAAAAPALPSAHVP
ncbi:MAG TPA: MFS transporter [Thermoplasmata archaeon]|nr:MFS transporter [Thermoplasmata archaeon]